MKLKGKVVVVYTVDGVEAELFIDGEQADDEPEKLAEELRKGTGLFVEVHVIPIGGARRTAKQILALLNRQPSPDLPEGAVLLEGGGVMLPVEEDREKTPLLEIDLDLGVVPERDRSEEETPLLEQRSLTEIDPFDPERNPDDEDDTWDGNG